MLGRTRRHISSVEGAHLRAACGWRYRPVSEQLPATFLLGLANRAAASRDIFDQFTDHSRAEQLQAERENVGKATSGQFLFTSGTPCGMTKLRGNLGKSQILLTGSVCIKLNERVLLQLP